MAMRFIFTVRMKIFCLFFMVSQKLMVALVA